MSPVNPVAPALPPSPLPPQQPPHQPQEQLPHPPVPTADAPAEGDAVIRWTRAAAVGSLLALIALGLAWELWLAPTGNGTLAVKVLPLALPLAGLLKHRMYTYRWVSLMVWLYFTEGVVRATSEHGTGALLALAEVLLCMLLFAACAVHVRWRLKRAAQRQPGPGDLP